MAEILIETEAGKEIKRNAFPFMHNAEMYAQIGRSIYKMMKAEKNLFKFIGYHGEIKI